VTAYRCLACKVDWPYDFGPFHRCPVCRNLCQYSVNDPLDRDDAASVTKHLRFELFYADRTARQLADEIDKHGVTA
jgi:hypothetical protein